MKTPNKLWINGEITKPLKSFYAIYITIAGIIAIPAFLIPLFTDKIDSIAKYEILVNFELEIRYLITFIIFVLFILIYLYFLLKYKHFKSRGIEAIVANPNNNANGKIINLGNLRFVLYSPFLPIYEIIKHIDNEEYYIRGQCTVTNISNSIVYISSVKFKDYYTGAFNVWNSGGKECIRSNQVTTVQFWAYIPISVYRPKKDIITDVTFTDNFNVEYTLKNIRFRYISKEKN